MLRLLLVVLACCQALGQSPVSELFSERYHDYLVTILNQGQIDWLKVGDPIITTSTIAIVQPVDGGFTEFSYVLRCSKMPVS